MYDEIRSAADGGVRARVRVLRGSAAMRMFLMAMLLVVGGSMIGGPAGAAFGALLIALPSYLDMRAAQKNYARLLREHGGDE